MLIRTIGNDFSTITSLGVAISKKWCSELDYIGNKVNQEIKLSHKRNKEIDSNKGNMLKNHENNLRANLASQVIEEHNDIKNLKT